MGWKFWLFNASYGYPLTAGLVLAAINYQEGRTGAAGVSLVLGVALAVYLLFTRDLPKGRKRR